MLAKHSTLVALAVLSMAWVLASRVSAMTIQGAVGEQLLESPDQDHIERLPTPPPVARYVSDEGESFVLDRSTPQPLLKFEESQEVLVLSPSPAARGDIIYRDDVGDPVLRATKLGGLTLFVNGRPGGAPVALEGQAPSLKLPQLSAGALLQRLGQASVRASRAAKHLIVFDAQFGAQEMTPDAAAVFGDAAGIAAEAVVRLARRSDGSKVLARLERVLFQPGRSSDAALSHGVMKVTLNPSQGLAGRPSSARIMDAALDAR